MNNLVSTWSPNDIVLPTVSDDLDYAFYFVTEAGSISGLNIEFSEGDWLVYIKKDGVANWYKTNGITVFNTSSSANNPSPGIYTKVRLDNNGNVIAGDYLEAEDLPTHTHVLDEISDKDNLTEFIQDTIGNMFTSSDNSSINLSYDSKNKIISAEVNYDGETIDQNEYGQLVATGSSSDSSSSSSGTVSITDVEDLTAKLSVLQTAITQNSVIANSDSGLIATINDGGTELKVNVDGTSIQINAYGQLEVNPDFTVDSDGNITSNSGCANHEHTADQIQDLEEYVLNLINENSAIDVNNLPVDGSTIIVNSSGQLSAVSTAIASHNHVMDDITDLNQKKADVWASDQPIVGDINNDYTKGIINLTDFTIGISIEKLSEKMSEMQTTLDYVESMVGKIQPVEPGDISYTTFTPSYVNEKTVVNVNTLAEVQAGTNVVFTSDLYYPCNKGTLKVFIDNKEYDSITFNKDTVAGTTSGNIEVSEIKDSYYDTVSFQGFYNSAILTYTTPELSGGVHYIEFSQTIDGEEVVTKPISFNIYNDLTPEISGSVSKTIEANNYVSGVHVYQGDGVMKASFVVSDYISGIFMPKAILRSEIGGIIKEYSCTEYNNSKAYFTDIEFDALDLLDTNITFYTINFNEEKCNEIIIHVPYVLVDSTTVDESTYRYIPISGETEVVTKTAGLTDYDPQDAVPNIELVLRDNIARFDNTDYSKKGIGPNYSDLCVSDYNYRWINFVFPCDYKSNISMKIVDKDGNPFTVSKNGTLDTTYIYVGQSNCLVPEVWVNGNKPYKGYGKASGVSFTGLDLFKSTDELRYVTFGQQPQIDGGYIFVRIGITSEKTLDCDALVNSILESINE